MKITKLRFKNAFGITERELDPHDITLIEGVNESGKTSILDSIKATLTNKNVRTRLVKNGSEEAELYIETDTGLVIDRKKRLYSSDYINVKDGSGLISSPESYLKTIFSTEQFNPIKDFIEKRPREQKKTILSICSIPFGEQEFINNFGEVPQDYIEGDHVLENLERIQAKTGHYYLTREDKNRQRRSKENIRDDIKAALPSGYYADDWKDVKLSEIYEEIEKANNGNAAIESCESYIANSPTKVEAIEGNTLKSITDIKSTYEEIISEKQEDISNIKEKIKNLQQEIQVIEKDILNERAMREEKIRQKQEKKETLIAEVKEKVLKSEDYVSEHEKVDVEPMKEKAKHTEEMKGFLREAEKIDAYNAEILDLKNQADEFTRKIELARSLPTQLLETAKMPIPGISIKDGELLIDDLPIDNLSEGRQMEIALEVAKAKAGELKVVLIDGFEKLCTKRREEFFEKAKKTGLQFFITRVTDSEELNIIEI